ncbi:MAG: FecR domain-containing protein [Candidatus Acidiferrum sp.]
MKNSAKTIVSRSVGFLLLGAMLSVPAWAQYPPSPNGEQNPPNQNAPAAQIGAINYVEGSASINSQELGANSVGSAVLAQGQELTTQTGRVEILLTPGVILRVDHNSTVKMVSPDLADTKVAVLKGRAMVEVTDISKNNNIRVDLNDTSVQLLKNGLYDFDADHNQVRVFKGKANVFAGNRTIGVGDNHEVTLAGDTQPKSKGFNDKQYTDDFFRWSGLRAGYLAEADADTARLYVNGGPGWYGAGWYWDPWFGAYTFIPGAGIFYSPFGWGFYSPFAVYGSPFFYGGFGYGHYHRFGDFHGPYGHGFEPQGGFHGAVGGGFHGGGFTGGGFHGGGGGGHH